MCAGRDHEQAAFFVTEYVSRGSLRDVLDRDDEAHILTNDLRLSMALDASRGMEFLHSKNVLHRDLKVCVYVCLCGLVESPKSVHALLFPMTEPYIYIFFFFFSCSFPVA